MFAPLDMLLFLSLIFYIPSNRLCVLVLLSHQEGRDKLYYIARLVWINLAKVVDFLTSLALESQVPP